MLAALQYSCDMRLLSGRVYLHANDARAQRHIRATETARLLCAPTRARRTSFAVNGCKAVRRIGYSMPLLIGTVGVERDENEKFWPKLIIRPLL